MKGEDAVILHGVSVTFIARKVFDIVDFSHNSLVVMSNSVLYPRQMFQYHQY